MSGFERNTYAAARRSSGDSRVAFELRGQRLANAQPQAEPLWRRLALSLFRFCSHHAVLVWALTIAAAGFYFGGSLALELGRFALRLVRWRLCDIVLVVVYGGVKGIASLPAGPVQGNRAHVRRSSLDLRRQRPTDARAVSERLEALAVSGLWFLVCFYAMGVAVSVALH